MFVISIFYKKYYGLHRDFLKNFELPDSYIQSLNLQIIITIINKGILFKFCNSIHT